MFWDIDSKYRDWKLGYIRNKLRNSSVGRVNIDRERGRERMEGRQTPSGE